MHLHLSTEHPPGGVAFAPPPVAHESVPAPRVGHAWVPGYWDWKNGRHLWVSGRWVPARQGCHWRRHRWILRDTRWFLEPGDWVLDERIPLAERTPSRARAVGAP